MVHEPYSPLSLPRSRLFPATLALVLAGLAALLAACAGAPLPPTPTLAPTLAPTLTPTTATTASPTPCAPAPVVVPTLPAEIPRYTDLDPSTHLHMTGSYQVIDVDSYRLEVTGLVDHPLSLSYDNLRCMPKVEKRAKLVCLGFFEDEAVWAGASLVSVLDLAGVQASAAEIEMTSADGYSNHLTLGQAYRPGNFLAYEWEGESLPILHGFPVRAVFPGEYGAMWVKWLIKIEVR